MQVGTDLVDLSVRVLHPPPKTVSTYVCEPRLSYDVTPFREILTRDPKEKLRWSGKGVILSRWQSSVGEAPEPLGRKGLG